jgi:hypothetical protein
VGVECFCAVSDVDTELPSGTAVSRNSHFWGDFEDRSRRAFRAARRA